MVSPAGPFVDADPEEFVMNRQTIGFLRIFHLICIHRFHAHCTVHKY